MITEGADDGTLWLLALRQGKLTPTAVARPACFALPLQLSWLKGAHVPQSVLASLYAHPVAVQTMRALTGRRAYTPSVGPDFRTGDAPSYVAGLEARPAMPVAAVPLPPLPAGGAPHALVTALLAHVTAGLKAVDTASRATFGSDVHSEENFTSILYGADAAWTVPLEEAADLLDAAEAALLALLDKPAAEGVRSRLAATLAGVPSVPESTAAAPPLARSATSWLRAATDVSTIVGSADAVAAGSPPPAGDDGTTATALSADVAALIARLRLRRVQLAVHALLSWGGRHAPAPPLQWGGTYALPAVAAGCRAATALLALVGATSQLLVDAAPGGKVNTTAIDDAALGVFPGYEKLLMSGHLRVLRHTPPGAVVAGWQRHWADVHAVTQLPALASHNPHRQYRPSDIYPAPPVKVEAEAAAPLHPEGARVTAGAYAPATVPFKVLAAAAGALGGGGAAAASATPVLVDIPPSGIVDPPVDWPGAPAATAAGQRQHVSLMALLSAVEQFSQRGASALARAWMLAVVLEQPHHFPAPDGGDDGLAVTGSSSLAGDPDADALRAQFGPPPTSSSSNPADAGAEEDEYAGWAGAHARSAVLLGSHTMQEALRVALLDGGAHPDAVASSEGRRFAFMMDRVLANLLVLLARSRTRARRLMDAQFRDWHVVCGECSYLDDAYARYVSARLAEADEAFVAGGGAHAAAGAPGATVATASGSPTGAATADEHAALHVMRRVAPLAPFSSWASGVVRWLQRLHTAVGAEDGLFHPDEEIALYWHLEVFATAARRRQEAADGVTGVLAAVPPLRRLSPYAAGRLAAGAPHTLALGVPTPPVAGAGETPPAPAAEPQKQAGAGEDALPSLRAGGGGGKKGKGGKGAASSPLPAAAAAADPVARLRELVVGWTAGVDGALRAAFSGGATAAAPGQPPSPPPQSRASLLLEAQQQVCCGLLRLLLGAGQLGLYRGLRLHVPPSAAEAVRALPHDASIATLPGVDELLYAPPHADASLAAPPSSIRVDGRLYESRWGAVNLVPTEAPVPPWWKYVDSICHNAVTRSTAAGWLRQAAERLKLAQAAAVPVLAQARAAMAGDAAALGLVAPPPAAAVSTAVATPAPKKLAAGGGGNGKHKKGKAAAAGDDDEDALLAAAAAAAAAAQAAPTPASTSPPPPSSWAVLTAAADAGEAQRLARVCVASLVTAAALGRDGDAFAALPADPAPGSGARAASSLDPAVVGAWAGRWASAGSSLAHDRAYHPVYAAPRLVVAGAKAAAAAPKG